MHPGFIRLLSLVVLVVQNASVALVMRYSFVVRGPNDAKYLPAVAVLMQEALKFLLSILFLFVELQYSPKAVLSALSSSLNVREILPVSVPAFLYIVQNNLLYFAR
jgi:UDP-sugar transporter A1/2/3